jgi:hypothetical protein
MRMNKYLLCFLIIPFLCFSQINELTFNYKTANFSSAPRTGMPPMSMRLLDNYNNGGPTTYGTVLEVYGLSGHQTSQLYFGGWDNSKIRYRQAFYADTAWNEWITLLDSKNNIASEGNLQLTGSGNHYLSAGNLGIGTQNPLSKLDVRGIISTPEIAFRNADGGDDSDPYRLRKVQGSSNVNWLELQLNDDFNESFRIYGNSCVGFGCGEYSGNLYHSFDAGGNVFHSGNVGIGTTTPAYKLDVIGTIRSREIKVDMNGADFVFEEKYPLMPLSELETYIKKHKHLPEIAPAKEMQEQGSNLGDLNTRLLQKIEELTLYVIQQQKDIEILKMELKIKK